MKPICFIGKWKYHKLFIDLQNMNHGNGHLY